MKNVVPIFPLVSLCKSAEITFLHMEEFFIPSQILRHAQKQWFFILLGQICLFHKTVFPYLHYPLVYPIPIPSPKYIMPIKECILLFALSPNS